MSKNSEKTEKKQSKKGPKKPLPHAFKPGQSGNPAGRPAGVKNYLTQLRELILEIFKENEDLFTDRLRLQAQEDPVAFFHAYIKTMMPTEMQLDANINANVTSHKMTKAELLERMDELRSATQRRDSKAGA